MRRATLLSLAAVLVMASQLSAANIRYMNSGDWSVDAGWQGGVKPGVNDTARMNWGDNTVDVTTTESVGRVQVGVDEKGTLDIFPTGNLTTDSSGTENGDVVIGNGNAAAGTGAMLVQSGGILNVGNILYHGSGNSSGTTGADGASNIFGTVNVSSHLWTGWGGNKTGTIDVNNGGELNVGGMLGLNWRNNGAVGILNVNDGGTVNLSQIHADGVSVNGTSLVTIAGSGVLTKTDNFVGVIQDKYVDAGKIVGEGGAPLSVAYNANTNLTTVTVIPEPTTIFLLGVGLGGILISRRR